MMKIKRVSAICLILSVTIFQGCATIPGRGRLYEPGGDGAHPAIIVLHSSGGLTSYEDRYAQYLARKGYYAITVNYFGAGGLDNIELAYDFLASNSKVDPQRIGLIGFSKGGTQAIAFAAYSHKFTDDRRVKAIVSYYLGPRIPLAPDKEPPAILFLHGENDGKVTPMEISRYCKGMAEKNVICERKIYKGVGHAFDRKGIGCAECDGYDFKATADSRKRTLEFLDRVLKTK